MGLLTEYPSWFIVFCLFLGLTYAFLLYFRTNKEIVKPWVLRLMSVCRFFSVFLISFLLLSPLVRQQRSSVEKPVIIVGQDNSESMVLNSDSGFLKGQYQENLKSCITELEDRFDVRTYSFGEDVVSPMRTDFSEKLTDMSYFFSEIKNRYLNRNVGAVIVSSDGIYNFGTDPYYAAKDINFPLYMIATGDTSIRRDLSIRKVLFNARIFLGDKFPIEIQVDAKACNGEFVNLTVKEKNAMLWNSEISVNGNHFSGQIPVFLEAKEPGWHRYTIELKPVVGELSPDNNRQDIFIEVLDVRTKILIVYDAPHPDLGAIRKALEGNEKYELIEKTSKEFLLHPDSVPVVIFYQVPGMQSADLSESIISKLPGALFIFGSLSDIPAFNSLNSGLILTTPKLSFSESLPVLNEAFPYFTVDKSLSRLFNQFSPLQSPFGTYQYSPLMEVLAFQEINGITSHFPLICFTQLPDRKRGFITGENLWRWRILNFTLTGECLAFDELIQKTVQFLAVKQDRSFLRIRMKPEFKENEPVEMEAELYNQSYELINDPDIAVVITDESGNNYTFTFGQTGKAYFLRVGTFPPGIYSFRADVTSGKNHYEKQGSFIVTPVNLEAINLTSNHNLLYRLAESHGGRLLYPGELDTLVELLKQNKEIHAISYVQKTFSELINAFWVFLLIVGLLTGEWVLRKYTGI